MEYLTLGLLSSLRNIYHITVQQLNFLTHLVQYGTPAIAHRTGGTRPTPRSYRHISPPARRDARSGGHVSVGVVAGHVTRRANANHNCRGVRSHQFLRRDATSSDRNASDRLLISGLLQRFQDTQCSLQRIVCIRPAYFTRKISHNSAASFIIVYFF